MILSACGNECFLCPRFMPKTDKELSHTATLWYQIGYRDRVVSDEEIACYGCTENNWCRYDIVKCTSSHGITNCGECNEYPCEKINQAFISTMKWEPRCKEVLTKDEYEMFDKAFFHKKEYLDRQKMKSQIRCHIEEISDDKLDEYALVIRNGFKDIADKNGFTVENNPHHGAFMKSEQLRKEKHNGIKMYAMYCNDTLCGAISLVMHDSNCEIEHFCVIPEFRHLGLGALLIKHCVSKAQKLGFCEIRAGIIDSNKVLKQWYLKNGFEVVETRNYPGLSFTVCNIKYTINKKVIYGGVKMIKLTLKDGSVREIENAMSAAEIVKNIGMGLYKAACAVKLDGKVCDLRTTVDSDCEFEVLTFDSPEGKHTFRHSAAHLLAEAVKELFPDAKLATGPATDNGFFYDFNVKKPFTAEDLVALEKKMKELVKKGAEIERFELSPEEAVKLMTERDEPLKLELIKKHVDKGDTLSFYKQGEFVDLCAGPHLMSMAPIKAFKLTACTGAYWMGNSEGPQLSRIYGTAFPKASELEEYLKAVEEAKLRDHNKIGRELEYFTTVDYIGQGLPIMLPKGARVIQLLQRWIEDEEQKRGYQLTKTPFMAKRDLYKISGHWDHYRDGMFILGDPDDETKECFALRPMTCPFQYQVFLNRQRSYRDLPMRLGETSTLFRNEDSGEMHGLIRVRQFTISEGHLIIRPDQLEEEFRGCLDLANYVLETLGLKDDVTYRFSQWDPDNTAKYEGTAEQWDHAQGVMKKILDHIGIEYAIGIDEAAFYGPKLDIQMKNVYGKEDTLVTIQIDMLLAQKFGMEYVDTDGSKTTPYIIHRTSLGCYERTLAILIEKYAGAMPLWLAPTQVEIMPISDGQLDYSDKLFKKLDAVGIRAHVDSRNEKIGYKIRQAQLDKVPYMLVIGDKEIESGNVAVRSRKTGETEVMTADELVSKLVMEVASKAL